MVFSVGRKMHLKTLGEGPWQPDPDRLPIYHGDRHHFHRRISEKTFVCLMNGLDTEMSFIDRDLGIPCEIKHNIARDPVQ